MLWLVVNELLPPSLSPQPDKPRRLENGLVMLSRAQEA